MIRRFRGPLAAAGVLLFTTACSTSTTYAPYEGGEVVQGQGGTKRVVDGVDFWENGSPPRKYKVLGVIDDSRRQSVFGMADYEAALARKAKEAGGDAIIVMDAHSDVRGYSTTGNAFQGQGYQNLNATTTAIKTKVTKAAVIKYVSE